MSDEETLAPTGVPSFLEETGSPTAPTFYPTLVDTRISSQDLALSFQSNLTIFLLILLGLVALLRFQPAFSLRVFFPAVDPKPNAWSFKAYFPSDDQVLANAGLDAYVSVRIHRLAVCIFAMWSPLALIVLCASYASTEPSDDAFDTSTIQKISMTNLQEAKEPDSSFGLALACLYALTLGVLLLIKLEYENFAEKKLKHLVAHAKDDLTVIVEKIPGFLLSKQNLTKYFESLFGPVLVVDLVPQNTYLSTLAKLEARKESLLLSLERMTQTEAENQPKLVDYDLSSTKKLFNRHFSVLQQDFDPSQEFTKQEDDEINLIVNLVLENQPIPIKLQSLANSLSCGLLLPYLSNAKKVSRRSYTERMLESTQLVITLLQSNMNHLLDSELVEPNPAEAEDEGVALLRKFEQIDPVSLSVSQRLCRIVSSVSMKKLGKVEEETRRQRLVKSAAFVTFKHKYYSEVSAKLRLTQVLDSLLVSPARKAPDILFENLGTSALYRILMRFPIFFANMLLLIFFGTFVSSIAVATNLDNLRLNYDSLDDFLLRNEYLVDLLEQVAPLLLILVFSLLPTVILWVQNYGKPLSLSELHAGFFRTYFFFLILQLFLFYQISGSLATILGQSIQNPVELIDVLAATIPNNAVFFMQFILVRTLFLLPLQMLRVGDVVFHLVRKAVYGTGGSEREKKYVPFFVLRHIDQVQTPFLAATNANAMLVYTIGIVYAVISPLVGVITLGFAVLTLLVSRQQYCCVYAEKLKPYDSLGTNFKGMVDALIFALILLILTMMGMFALFERPSMLTLCLPLLVLVVLTYIYFDKVYAADLEGMPLAIARIADIDMETDGIKRGTGQFKHPSLTVQQEEHTEQKEMKQVP